MTDYIVTIKITPKTQKGIELTTNEDSKETYKTQSKSGQNASVKTRIYVEALEWWVKPMKIWKIKLSLKKKNRRNFIWININSEQKKLNTNKNLDRTEILKKKQNEFCKDKIKLEKQREDNY